MSTGAPLLADVARGGEFIVGPKIPTSGNDSQKWGTLLRGRLKRVTKIWERLYIGNLKDAAQVARSNPKRIGTVISLCEDQALQRTSKIIYIHIPLPDARGISRQKFEDVMFAIAIGVRRGSVLLHCREGMNRSPIMMAAWMDRCGYSEIDKALAEIAKMRDLAPQRALLNSVKELLRNAPERRS